MQYIEIFSAVKNENLGKNAIFNIFAQNIDCEYPQSMFWSKNKKKGIPLHTLVFLYKSGVKGDKLFMDMFS